MIQGYYNNAKRETKLEASGTMMKENLILTGVSMEGFMKEALTV